MNTKTLGTVIADAIKAMPIIAIQHIPLCCIFSMILSTLKKDINEFNIIH